MNSKFKSLIESELTRRAQIMVCARRISLAEDFVIERKVKGDVRAKLASLLDQSEDEDGTDDSRWDALQRARELAGQNKIDLSQFKAEHENGKEQSADEVPDDADESGDEEPVKKPFKPGKTEKPAVDADDEDESDDVPVKGKKPFGADDSDESDDDEAPVPAKVQKDGEGVPSSAPQPHSGGETQTPNVPAGGEDAISNGDVTYKVKDNKFGETAQAIPQAWFDTWLDKSKHSPQELQAMLAKTRLALTKLSPPTNTGDKQAVSNHKAHSDGFRNKMKAISAMLGDLEKRHNKDIEGHNKKQERNRGRINDLVDTLSGGNPLLKTLVGLMADRLIKNKDKANYTGQSRSDDFDFGEE